MMIIVIKINHTSLDDKFRQGKIVLILQVPNDQEATAHHDITKYFALLFDKE